jgi:hypothetical protein
MKLATYIPEWTHDADEKPALVLILFYIFDRRKSRRRMIKSAAIQRDGKLLASSGAFPLDRCSLAPPAGF